MPEAVDKTLAAEFVRMSLAKEFLVDIQAEEDPEGAWGAWIADMPTHGDGSSRDEALSDLAGALREYAIDWLDHLHEALNHVGHRYVVYLVLLSTDEQLLDWLKSYALPRPS